MFQSIEKIEDDVNLFSSGVDISELRNSGKNHFLWTAINNRNYYQHADTKRHIEKIDKSKSDTVSYFIEKFNISKLSQFNHKVLADLNKWGNADAVKWYIEREKIEDYDGLISLSKVPVFNRKDFEYLCTKFEEDPKYIFTCILDAGLEERFFKVNNYRKENLELIFDRVDITSIDDFIEYFD